MNAETIKGGMVGRSAAYYQYAAGTMVTGLEQASDARGLSPADEVFPGGHWDRLYFCLKRQRIRRAGCPRSYSRPQRARKTTASGR